MHNMQQNQLPTVTEMAFLKRELNHLLWTKDAPPMPEGLQTLYVATEGSESISPNIQCTSHAVVVGALLMRRGLAVTMRGGKAFVLDPAADQDQANDYLNEIVKHWWLTVDGHGLVDLSLYGESEHPLVYCNRSIGERWQIQFSDSLDKLPAFLNARRRGCFYLTLSKKRATKIDLDQAFTQPVPPAKNLGIDLTYSQFVGHCERLLEDSQKSLTHLPQVEAWRSMVR
jgi:hypothetical protein